MLVLMPFNIHEVFSIYPNTGSLRNVSIRMPHTHQHVDEEI
jgi:hypothetical protein